MGPLITLVKLKDAQHNIVGNPTTTKICSSEVRTVPHSYFIDPNLQLLCTQRSGGDRNYEINLNPTQCSSLSASSSIPQLQVSSLFHPIMCTSISSDPVQTPLAAVHLNTLIKSSKSGTVGLISATSDVSLSRKTLIKRHNYK